MTQRSARPFYFGPPSAALFGWFHPPQQPARDAVVVICPPVGVEGVFSRRGLRHLAEHLAQNGFAVLRYDHHGTGDSAGLGTEANRVTTWVDGVNTAIDAAKARSGAAHVALVGLRLGATLGAVAGSQGAPIDSLVLWAPIENGRRYVRELGAFSQMGGAPNDGGVGGFYFAPETLESISALDLRRLTQRPAARALIIPRDDLTQDSGLAPALTALGTETTTAAAPGYAATVAEPHKTEVPAQVIESIVTWLSQSYAAASAAQSARSQDARTTMETSEVSGVKGAPAPVRERSVFLDPDQRLVAMLTEPVAGVRRKTTIILLNAGAVARIGPNRMYVTMARQWAAMGFRVLRMDLGGMGDSVPRSGLPENDTYPTTAVADVIAAIETLRREGEERFVVAGLCSGAHAAFHFGLESAAIPGVTGLVLMNPIVFYWKPGDALDVSAWQTYAEARRYKSRVKNPEAWVRLVRGRVNVSEFALTVFRRAATLVTAARARARSRRSTGPSKEDLAKDLVGLVGRPLSVCMVFSDGDPGLDQLNLHARHVLGRLRHNENFHIEIVQNADHTFTQLQAQSDLLRVLAAHLDETFD